ncbi:MAG: ABC transporter permease [Spirochaetales bacterium]|nr:ABC transporter permease [Spirochaetales bacterium]
MKQKDLSPGLGTTSGKVTMGMLLLKLRTLIALIILLIVFGLTAQNFFTAGNIIIMLKHAAVAAFLGIGMTFVIITGGIDLSVGSIVGLCGMIAGGLIYEGLTLELFGVIIYFHPLMVIIITLLLGALIGAVNGIVITKFKVTPFIATLGMYYAARGLANIRTGGMTFPNLSGDPALGTDGFPVLGSGTVFGIPLIIWILIAVAAGAIYMSRKTPLGRHIYAIGGNEKAAKLSGIRVHRVKIFVYMFSGFCSAIAGLIWASQLNAAHPGIGTGFELNAIAAAVLGGTSMSGGFGTIGGTVIGALVIGVLSDGMVMVGIDAFWQNVIKGVVIVVAVIIDQMQQSMKVKSVERTDRTNEKETA